MVDTKSPQAATPKKAPSPKKSAAKKSASPSHAGKKASSTSQARSAVEHAKGTAEGAAKLAAAKTEHAKNMAMATAQDFTGTINAVDLLITQHNETKSLLSKIISTKDAQARWKLFEMMCDAVAGHMHIEEEIFYPAAGKAEPSGHSKVKHAEKEHDEAKEIMTKLLKMQNAESSEFEPLVVKLKDALEHHIKEEEEDMLPKAKKLMDDAKLQELGHEMHKRFGELASKPNPRFVVFKDLGKAPPKQ
jgi:hemerythrin-like domain-containing protein